ncbi:phage holin family protein [Alkalibacter rhizosphaerae]|uniref:Phage holin family protein n=1 Tax=Alkalibacter rhizosphaerae TaxID=2815577 RepID=A0A974XJF9_9FIRM|nr:phage holin family protein [Alkalibacter rhizosphaerae]QSX09528.1 phage holin family protein [Alkalibacter rhizosphaerae]
MKEIWNWIQITFTAIGGCVGYLLGGFDGFLYALITFVVIDYITGVMCAILDGKLSSEVGFHGIFKKVFMFSLVAIGQIVDQFLIKNGSVVRTAVIFFYLSNEGVSILENAAHIGLPVPQKLKDILEQLNSESGKEDTK